MKATGPKVFVLFFATQADADETRDQLVEGELPFKTIPNDDPNRYGKVPEVFDGLVPLVLHFEDDATKEAFIALVVAANPNLSKRCLR